MSEEQSKEKQTAIEELADDDKNRELIEEAVENETKKVIAEVIQGEFSGPIPPPSIIEGYERVLPGSADRIITMAEKQSEHRQKMEEKMISAESRDSLLGVIFAFFTWGWMYYCSRNNGMCCTTKQWSYCWGVFRRDWNRFDNK